jgi:hypothetical protein
MSLGIDLYPNQEMAFYALSGPTGSTMRPILQQALVPIRRRTGAETIFAPVV